MYTKTIHNDFSPLSNESSKVLTRNSNSLITYAFRMPQGKIINVTSARKKPKLYNITICNSDFPVLLYIIIFFKCRSNFTATNRRPNKKKFFKNISM